VQSSPCSGRASKSSRPQCGRRLGDELPAHPHARGARCIRRCGVLQRFHRELWIAGRTPRRCPRSRAMLSKSATLRCSRVDIEPDLATNRHDQGHGIEQTDEDVGRSVYPCRREQRDGEHEAGDHVLLECTDRVIEQDRSLALSGAPVRSVGLGRSAICRVRLRRA
jgi:hypothetical protein